MPKNAIHKACGELMTDYDRGEDPLGAPLCLVLGS